MLPDASRATAVSVCVPGLLVAVSQPTEYGAARVLGGEVWPSSLNCTPATLVLSEAAAVTATVPLTVAPFAGAVIDTVGGVVSHAPLPAVSGVRGETLPASSNASTPSW